MRNHDFSIARNCRGRFIPHFGRGFPSAQKRNRAVEKKRGEQALQETAIEIADQIRHDRRPQRSGEFKRHAQANVGGVALQVN